jgi:hypothetical protein
MNKLSDDDLSLGCWLGSAHLNFGTISQLLKQPVLTSRLLTSIESRRVIPTSSYVVAFKTIPLLIHRQFIGSRLESEVDLVKASSIETWQARVR